MVENERKQNRKLKTLENKYCSRTKPPETKKGNAY